MPYRYTDLSNKFGSPKDISKEEGVPVQKVIIYIIYKESI